MPFRSAKQRAFLRHRHPEIYRRWVREHGTKVVKKSEDAMQNSALLHKKAAEFTPTLSRPEDLAAIAQLPGLEKQISRNPALYNIPGQIGALGGGALRDLAMTIKPERTIDLAATGESGPTKYVDPTWFESARGGVAKGLHATGRLASKYPTTAGTAALLAALGAGYGGYKMLSSDDEEGRGRKRASDAAFQARVVTALQTAAVALQKAEQQQQTKQASDARCQTMIPELVDKCVKYGRINDTPEERTKLASWLSTPEGALTMFSNLISHEPEQTNETSLGRPVDANGHQKKASYNSRTSCYVGRHTGEESEAWKRFSVNLGIA